MISSLLDDLLALKPFSLNKTQKEQIFLSKLNTLCKFHYEKCQEYKKILDILGKNYFDFKRLDDLPFLPVSLFKKFNLKSISDDEVFKITTSSGTSGQAVSKIFLDKKTAQNQQKVLSKIVCDFIGNSRLPMLVIDSPSVIKDKKQFSARGAGILGFSIFGSNLTYALDDDMQIDFEVINNFLAKHNGKKILLFGFTFMIWQFFYKKLLESGKKLDLQNAILFHGGGWKKLANEAVSKSEFNQRLFEVSSIKNIHDYYGMVEQTGCIYVECEEGHMHVSNFSDIIIRNPRDFSACEVGQKGLIELVSLLPTSYPGQCLLSEDEGVILGIDDCPCGRLGKYFKILGRVKNAEIRGCSDTYEKH